MGTIGFGIFLRVITDTGTQPAAEQDALSWRQLSRVYHFNGGNRDHHLATPVSDVLHLRNNLVLQVPR